MRSALRAKLDQVLDGASPDKLPSLLSAVNRADATDLGLETAASIHFLRNYTIELIEPFLKYYLYKEEIKPFIVFGGYNTFRQELLDEDSHVHQKPDLIVLSLMLDQLDPSYGTRTWTAEKTKEHVQELFELVAANSESTVAVNTFIPPFYREQGITMMPTLPDFERGVCDLNLQIRKFVANNSSKFFLMDWERFLRILGEENSIDYRYWYLSKAPFKKHFLNLYAREITRLVRAMKGKGKKCLVLDCDNTLWGGVIGEDGPRGIKLDPNDWPGNAFYDFQKTVLALFGRGVLIILCSKNNEQDVWDVLDNHPHCLLKREHLAAWRINWDNKANNLVSLAEELNVGIESFVFVEDSPAECELVRQNLPSVTVLPVPENLYTYPNIVLEDGLFDTLSLTQEDKQRTVQYQQTRKRQVQKNMFTNIDDYLTSLEMEAGIHEAKIHEIPRIAQLTQKTNQFNLTTRRYSETHVETLLNSDDAAIFTLTARDKFGDLGLTGVLIAKHVEAAGFVDTLLLSCRILGRELEQLFVDRCMSILEDKWSLENWQAEYIATEKNQHVANFWEQIGFTSTSDVAGIKRYSMPVEQRLGYQKNIVKVIGQ
ncbi:MAG: HAD-IIIC family phosphatase [Acidiferrobacterales bacterium]